MSTTALSLQANERTVVGKKVKALRRDNQIPAVVYERGVGSDLVSIDRIQLTKVWNSAGKHHAISLEYGKKQRLTIIKDVDIDPTKGTLAHVAFHAIKQNEKVETEVPVRLEGQAPATVKGMLVHPVVDHIVVRALPSNLPDELVADITGLQDDGDNVFARELLMPKDVELVTELDQVIACVVVPRAEVEKASAAEEEADQPATAE